VAFVSSAANLVEGDKNGAADVFVHDRQGGHTTRVSVASDGTQGNDGSYCPSISADGRFMAFDSYADNLVDGDTNGGWDVFLHDRQTGLTARVSVASDGGEGNAGSYGPCISADGCLIAFVSAAGNLVAGDTNGPTDVFVHDRSGLFLLGDVNDDCVVNILDLIAIRNGLNGDVSEGENAKLDVNRDGAINILDMILVRNELNTMCE
jgi:Tol biopolymer transport system component